MADTVAKQNAALLSPWRLVTVAARSASVRIANPRLQGVTLRGDFKMNRAWITSSLSLSNPLTYPSKQGWA